MKIFSKAPKIMRADRIGTLIWHIALAVIAASIMTGDLTQAAFVITSLLIIIGLDLRDRAQEIFQQNEHLLLLSAQIKINLSAFSGHQVTVTQKMDGENTSTLALEEQKVEHL